MWTGSDRSDRLPENWNSIRARVLVRDKYRCKLRLDDCLIQAREVDHIIPGDDHSLTNLRAVCSKCHARKSSQEGHDAKAHRKQLRLRPREAHPGVISDGSEAQAQMPNEQGRISRRDSR